LARLLSGALSQPFTTITVAATRGLKVWLARTPVS